MARSRGQSSPIIPHLSGVQATPHTQATRVLYDRLNDIETRTLETLEAQQRIIDTQAEDLASLRDFVRTNKVATDAFLASQAFSTQVGSEAGVPTPPPGEPGGGGGGTPPPPGAPPVPDHRVYVMEMAAQYPADLAAACKDPVNRVWLERVCHRLRQIDSRWGYCQIHSSPPPSHDKLCYYYGDVSVPREGSQDTYTFDLIGDLSDTPGSESNTPVYLYDGEPGAGPRWVSLGQF